MAYPDIFAYADHRRFLKDWFTANRRATGTRGTSAFARIVGCAPGHVQNVVAGRRKLARELVPGFCAALSLGSEGAEFFLLLVRHAYPISEADRALAERMLAEARARPRVYPGPPGRPRGRPRGGALAVSDRDLWLDPVVRALLACPGAPTDGGGLAAALRPALSPVQGAALLARVRGGAVPWTEVVADPARPETLAVTREALRVARQFGLAVPEDERQIWLNVGPVSDATRDQLLALADAYLDEVRALLSAPEDADERAGEHVVFQVSLQVLPLSKRLGS